MQIYVGITDYNWFQFLKERKSEEVIFGSPEANLLRRCRKTICFCSNFMRHRIILSAGDIL